MDQIVFLDIDYLQVLVKKLLNAACLNWWLINSIYPLSTGSINTYKSTHKFDSNFRFQIDVTKKLKAKIENLAVAWTVTI